MTAGIPDLIKVVEGEVMRFATTALDNSSNLRPIVEPIVMITI